MIREIKNLGLATVAVLAASALVASAAQAQFTSNSAPTTVTATSALGNDVIVIDGSSVECAVHYEGTMSEVSVSSVEVTPTFTNCRAFGFASAGVTTKNCRFIFFKIFGIPVVSFSCETFDIHAGNCEVQIGSQSGLKSVTLTNHHPHFDMDLAITGITANRTKDGFLCPLNGTGHVSNASYTQGSAIHVEPKSGGTTISVD